MAVDAYAQRVLRHAELHGQLLPVVYLGAPGVAVVLQQQLAAPWRKLPHAALKALVCQLGLFRLGRVGRGRRRGLRRLPPQRLLKTFCATRRSEARVADVVGRDLGAP